MGRIRLLSDQVANQIAAGEVVDRPQSVVKELVENSLDAGAWRIRVEVEAGGRRLIRIADDGCGMSRDDALLAFERHATSKLRSSDDLLEIATLGFRGEALPSIASVARVTLETSSGEEPVGTRIEIAGGRIHSVSDAALPRGTTLTVSELFFNTPARRKFLRAESTELSHVTALVTHYALAHPERHFELASTSHTLLSAPPVARTEERIYQIFGREMLDQLLPLEAAVPLERSGLPEPPPWRRDPAQPERDPGILRLTGFFSRPELQKLNRNSIYIFVNRRLIRDRVLLHAIGEAYRNVLPPTSFPVVLLFLELPPAEVDVNVHPAKTEVRFRQQSLVHDLVRDSIREALVRARPAAGFLATLESAPTAGPSLALPPSPPAGDLPDPAAGPRDGMGDDGAGDGSGGAAPAFASPFFASQSFATRSFAPARLPFLAGGVLSGAEPATPAPGIAASGIAAFGAIPPVGAGAGLEGWTELSGVEEGAEPVTLNRLGSLRPLGQLRESFILAVGEEGLWIIDQHVAHERVLFERILRSREVERVQRQRLLMPMLVELKPWQMVVFAEIADELERNGFEVEPFGPGTLAVKAAPVGLEGQELERTITEVIEQSGADSGDVERNQDLGTLQRRVAASIACHSAIKVNTPLDPSRMEWLLRELARTEHPTSCPHGRPIALLHSLRDIQRAFHRI